MDKQMMQNFRDILMNDMITALGCTEPIAIALAGARAREELGVDAADIEKVDVYCSGNIVKNVKGVTVPNSGGLRGIDVAVALGIESGSSSRGLELLDRITPEHVEEANMLISDGRINVHLIDDEDNLYLRVEATAGSDEVTVEIKHDHTRFSRIEKNGEVLLERKTSVIDDALCCLEDLSLKRIIEYADAVDFDQEPELRRLLDRQVTLNSEIAQEGLKNTYGAEVGRTLLRTGDESDPRIRAKAYTAAGSDARMGGSGMPVVINSGSGNQGMTVSIPIAEYARALGVSDNKKRRALIVSNLLAIHQKQYIGKLSAFCGIVSAAAAAGAGIAYLEGCGYEVIVRTITNTLVTIGGMLCDGAKASCASKIAVSLDNALMALDMAKNGLTFGPGEGLVGNDVEETIANIGRIARDGMRETDLEILKIMTE